MNNVSGVIQKLVRPFRWLFAKRKRWIPAVVILSLIALPFIMVWSMLLFRLVDNFSDDIRYRKGEETRIEQLIKNLENSQEKWISNNISSYKFNLEMLFGGHEMWEGFGGISSGATIKRLLSIKVYNGDTIEVTDNTTGNPVNISQNQYCDSMPELYIVIQDVLNGKDNSDLIFKANNLEGAKGIFSYSMIPRYVHAEFNGEYGYPVLIGVYRQYGNMNYYERFYEIQYSISDFEILK